jgi:hypothetical protein
MLVLALSDQFDRRHGEAASRALELVAQLPSEYERLYFGGLVAERRGRALLDRPGPGAAAAIEWLREAMVAYEAADALRPSGNDEARLRWNSCARELNARPQPTPHEDERSPVMSE